MAGESIMKSVQPLAIEVRIDPSQADRADLVHRFRNFGEDLWALLRGEGRVSIDLEAVDASLDHFRFSAANAIIAKRAVAAARELMAKHRLSGSVVVVAP